MRATTTVFLTLVLAGCSGGQAPAPGAATPAPRASSPEPIASAAAPAHADPSPAPSADNPPKPKEPGVEMPNVDFTEQEDDVDGWLKSKGITDTSSSALMAAAGLPDSMNVECDSVVPIGKPFERAALCRRQVLRGQWEIETIFLLLVPEGGKLRTVWQASSAAGLLNRSDTSELPFVQLNVSLQDDGLVLFLEEVPGFACDEGLRKIAEGRRQAEPDEKDSYANLDRIAAGVCRARGKYVWRNSTFARTGPVPRSGN